MFCPNCGKRSPDDSEYCQKCGITFYPAPVMTEDPVITRFTGGNVEEYAGFWQRLVAAIIDYFILISIGMVFAFITGFIFTLIMFMAGFKISEIEKIYTLIPDPLVLSITFLIMWLYFAVFEASGMGATPGKKILGMNVVGQYGDPIGFWQATKRFWCKLISSVFMIGFIMIAFHERKQGLHDLLAGTYVVTK